MEKTTKYKEFSEYQKDGKVHKSNNFNTFSYSTNCNLNKNLKFKKNGKNLKLLRQVWEKYKLKDLRYRR